MVDGQRLVPGHWLHFGTGWTLGARRLCKCQSTLCRMVWHQDGLGYCWVVIMLKRECVYGGYSWLTLSLWQSMCAIVPVCGLFFTSQAIYWHWFYEFLVLFLYHLQIWMWSTWKGNTAQWLIKHTEHYMLACCCGICIWFNFPHCYQCTPSVLVVLKNPLFLVCGSFLLPFQQSPAPIILELVFVEF